MTCKSLNVGVVGSGGVGKTAICIQQVRGEFEDWYIPTVEDKFSAMIDVDGESVRANIIDTAGQDEFKVLRSRWYQSVDCFIAVYSVTDPESIPVVEEIYREACEACSKNYIPCVVAGNKKDLSGPNTKCTEEKGLVFAQKLKAKHIYTSAKTALNVELLFKEAILSVFKKKVEKEDIPDNHFCCCVQ
jgi:small GTP-binding protein